MNNSNSFAPSSPPKTTSLKGLFASSPSSRAHSFGSPSMATLDEIDTVPDDYEEDEIDRGGNKEIEKELSLAEIQNELNLLMDQANKGEDFDENKLDYYLRKQEENEEYQQQKAAEVKQWRSEYKEYLNECLNITRSFVPSTIFHSNIQSLMELGLSNDVSKRLLQKQGVWLVRLSSRDISRLHEADLYGRYNTSLLDIVELAAVYCNLPVRFNNDPMNKKLEWRNNIETNLRRMMLEQQQGVLTRSKCRAVCYDNMLFGTNAPLSPVPSAMKDTVFNVDANKDANTLGNRSASMNNMVTINSPAPNKTSALLPFVSKPKKVLSATECFDSDSQLKLPVLTKNSLFDEVVDDEPVAVINRYGPIADWETLHQTEESIKGVDDIS